MLKNILFKDFAVEWLKEHEYYVKKSTFGTYSTIMYNHLIPYFKDIPISFIDQKKVNQLTLYLLNYGRLDQKGGLSEKSIKDILIVLKLCLKDAEEKKLVEPFVFKNQIIKKTKPRTCNILSRQEQRQLQEYILDHPSNRSIGILLMLQTGIRIGELCAIQWKDIDLTHKLIYITKTLQRIFIKNHKGKHSTQVIITSPKSVSSQRTIPISNLLIEAIGKLKVQETEEYFLTGTLKYTEPRTYLNYYKNFLQCADISYINLHGLRHTFATRCIESGADGKTVSEILGHSNVHLTMNLYVHPQIEQKRKCIEMANVL